MQQLLFLLSLVLLLLLLFFCLCFQDEIIAIGRFADPFKAAQQIIDWGCKCVVLTLGSEGAMLCFVNGINEVDCNTSQPSISTVSVGAFPVREIIDTTGAGDAFLGAFPVAWVRQLDTRPALAAGCLCGASAVQVLGGSTINAAYLTNAFQDDLPVAPQEGK